MFKMVDEAGKKIDVGRARAHRRMKRLLNLKVVLIDRAPGTGSKTLSEILHRLPIHSPIIGAAADPPRELVYFTGNAELRK